MASGTLTAPHHTADSGHVGTGQARPGNGVNRMRNRRSSDCIASDDFDLLRREVRRLIRFEVVAISAGSQSPGQPVGPRIAADGDAVGSAGYVDSGAIAWIGPVSSARRIDVEEY
jgi:hypothetical protein